MRLIKIFIFILLAESAISSGELYQVPFIINYPPFPMASLRTALVGVSLHALPPKSPSPSQRNGDCLISRNIPEQI